MRIGRNVTVRPLGGRTGCLAMVLVSVLASVVLTVILGSLTAWAEAQNAYNELIGKSQFGIL